MTQRVLDVGNCAPDHAAIRRLIEDHFDAEVIQAERAEDCLSSLRRDSFALVLVNRKLDCDYSDGVEVIRQVKQAADLRDTPCMLITNYAEHQEIAVAAGAIEGFGKLEFQDAAGRKRLAEQKLSKYLETTPE